MGNSVPFVKQKSKKVGQKSTFHQKNKFFTMKLLSASLIIGSAMADKWAKLGDLWNGLSQSDNVNEDDRKIIELFTISSVANYGCWCRFNQYRPYRGTPQDTVDTACKQWYQNYDCLGVDFNTQTPLFRCNLDVEYTDVITSLSDPFDPTTDYQAACAASNADACAAEACHVDAVFIRHVFLFLADNTLNMTLSGWYGFNGNVCTGRTDAVDGTTAAPNAATTAAPVPATTAPAGTTATPVPGTLCCGAYPNRYPYKTQGGDRQCCVDTTYNINVLECCAATNVLAVIGTC